ncbi:MAG: hypothetical protein WAW92_02695 [Minisyncoccia bacterium]
MKSVKRSERRGLDMDEFTRSLRSNIERSLGKPPSWEINPLVVIGLTEAMLDLGLTEDQMYAIVRSYARQLASQVHPDRQPENVSQEKRTRIMQAFEVLDERAKFKEALDEFRSLKSSDRSELNILRRSLASTREMLDTFRKKERELVIGREQFEQKRGQLERKISKWQLDLDTMKTTLESSERTSREHLSEARLYSRRYKALLHYLHQLVDESPSFVTAWDAHWIAVATLVPFSVEPVQEPLTMGGNPSKGLREAALIASISDESMERFLEVWKRRWKDLEKSAPGGFRSNYDVRLSIFTLIGGKMKAVYGWNQALEASGRIIGSLAPPSNGYGRVSLTQTLEEEMVVEYLRPYLVPEGLTVVERLHQLPSLASREVVKTVKFNTKSIILGAG